MSDAAAQPPEDGAAPAGPRSFAAGDSSWAVAWRQLRANRLAMLGGVVILVMAGIAVFAPLLANGRPLYIRGYLTNFYDDDVAAFLDWHARLLETTRRLRAGAPRRDQPLLRERLARYRAGVPRVLARLAQKLDVEQGQALRELGAEYQAACGRTPEAADLKALARLGATIDARYGALSLTTAYKRAARPLLAAEELVARVEEARHAGEPLAPLAEEGRRLAQAAHDASVALLTFLEVPERERLNDAVETGRASLARLDAPDFDPGAARAALHALERELDLAAETPVPPGRQRLPLVTRWPVLEALGAREVGFIVLYLSLLLCFAFQGPLLTLGPRLRGLAFLAPAVLATLGWQALVPAVQPPAESTYKAFAAQLQAHPDGVSAIVFPLVPFGENENLHADRVTPPVLWERRYELDGLAHRLRASGELEISHDEALARLDRLRSHWLGTDDNGRDILARLIYGSRVSLLVGFASVSIYVLIGVVLGAVAGYFGGWVDVLLMRVTEVVLCFPSFFLIITLMSVIEKPDVWSIVLVIGFTHWTEVMRLVRGEFLRLRALDFVAAGQALGFTPARVIFRHLLPNALGPVFVAVAFGVAGAILIESALSFLGFGVPPPTASWGSVLFVAFHHEKELWWVTIFAGLTIFVTITAYNLVGEGLRDALDPKLRQ